MVQLARVTADLNQRRGPDVVREVEVPATWLGRETTLEIDAPRLLCCAECQGGGCDVCHRKGAFHRDECAGVERTSVALPVAPLAGPLRVRLPGAGARASDESLPPGHLILVVRPGKEPSPGVRRVRTPPPPARFAKLPLVLVALAVVVSVVWTAFK